LIRVFIIENPAKLDNLWNDGKFIHSFLYDTDLI